MQGKSAYEIRTKLLELAYSILENQSINNPNRKDDELPTAPTTEAVIAEATKLNKFVSTKTE